MEPVQIWGIAVIMAAVYTFVWATKDAPMEPHLPEPVTDFEAFIGAFIIIGLPLTGLALFLLPYA